MSPGSPALLRRVLWRLVPFMMLLYFLAFLDRANVSFAKLTMNTDLGISETLYGLASGAFFWGYFVFEIPSNLLLERFGARRWICRIMITWGLVSAGMAFVVGPASYTALRILLGVAEAGFFPGMILYLTYWFPTTTRARVTALFVAAIPISNAVGAPLSTLVLSLEGRCGLHGWQWLFLLEGIPAVLCGLLVPFYLTDRPAEARWLAPQEREELQRAIDAENHTKPHMPFGRALLHPSILTLSLVYFCLMVGLYGLTFWLPTILKNQGLTTTWKLGLCAAIPYAIGALTMVPYGRHSDRTAEREWHVALAMALAVAGFALTAFARGPVGAIIGFSLVSMGIFGAMPAFWSLPTARLRGTAAAGGVALVNSLGNFGGSAGGYVVGFAADTRFHHAGGLLVVAALLLLGAAVVLFTRAGSAVRAGAISTVETPS